MDISKYHQVMNDTKWEEIRWAMVHYLKCIRWRTKDIENGYICPWDGEWFYHFRLGGYECIEWTPSLENMGNLIKTFSYGEEFANNENLIKMRYEASIQDGLQEAFSSMFPAPRQQHVDAIALSEDQLREIKTPLNLSLIW